MSCALVTGVQTCALPIYAASRAYRAVDLPGLLATPGTQPGVVRPYGARSTHGAAVAVGTRACGSNQGSMAWNNGPIRSMYATVPSPSVPPSSNPHHNTPRAYCREQGFQYL